MLRTALGTDLPVVEDALREGLSTGVGPEVGGEAEGLVDGQVGLDVEHGGAHHLGLLKDVATTTVQHTVDTADGVLGTLEGKKISVKSILEAPARLKIQGPLGTKKNS